ncbi:hypothetical protein GpartN1_g6397.t1 [Galdieria partita]|uniref:mRNA cap guanine-N(7) methyltransferase n=1 Tax=Galdieria partita TaxID=83374 RepID=A0A9C7UT13_9RHOD|nr:hypothetical protein GpartN1_g6397.t1 [Galdieria partita]
MEEDVVAKHYDQLASEDKATRKSSKILGLRNLNNWVKSVLIALHTRPGYSVLDLACGKGGDLQKWQSQQITQYVGCDISKESLKTAYQRYRQLNKCTFTAQFLCGDCFSCRLSRYLEPHRNFHLVSCQFSMHYAFSSEDKVRRLLENVTERLVEGGFFIGTIPDSNVLVRKLRACPGLEFGNEFYRVVFDDSFSSKTFKKPFGIRYQFYLESSVLDIPEYLVVMPVFEKLAKEYGLELQLAMNFHEFITMYLSPHSPFVSLFHRMNIFQGSSGLSPEFWDTAYLYSVFALKKQGASPWLGLSSESIPYVDNHLEEDESVILSMESEEYVSSEYRSFHVDNNNLNEVNKEGTPKRRKWQ